MGQRDDLDLTSLSPFEQAPAREFDDLLSELTVNSRPLIQFLTSVAADNANHLNAIAFVLEWRIYHSSTDKKLPLLYLLDSIVKNLRYVYSKRIAENIVETFTNAYELSPVELRVAMKTLLNTWIGLFDNAIIEAIWVRLQDMDKAGVKAGAIYINPKALRKTDGLQKIMNADPLEEKMRAKRAAQKASQKAAQKSQIGSTKSKTSEKPVVKNVAEEPNKTESNNVSVSIAEAEAETESLVKTIVEGLNTGIQPRKKDINRLKSLVAFQLKLAKDSQTVDSLNDLVATIQMLESQGVSGEEEHDEAERNFNTEKMDVQQDGSGHELKTTSAPPEEQRESATSAEGLAVLQDNKGTQQDESIALSDKGHPGEETAMMKNDLALQSEHDHSESASQVSKITMDERRPDPQPRPGPATTELNPNDMLAQMMGLMNSRTLSQPEGQLQAGQGAQQAMQLNPEDGAALEMLNNMMKTSGITSEMLAQLAGLIQQQQQPQQPHHGEQPQGVQQPQQGQRSQEQQQQHLQGQAGQPHLQHEQQRPPMENNSLPPGIDMQGMEDLMRLFAGGGGQWPQSVESAGFGQPTQAAGGSNEPWRGPQGISHMGLLQQMPQLSNLAQPSHMPQPLPIAQPPHMAQPSHMPQPPPPQMPMPQMPGMPSLSQVQLAQLPPALQAQLAAQLGNFGKPPQLTQGFPPFMHPVSAPWSGDFSATMPPHLINPGHGHRPLQGQVNGGPGGQPYRAPNPNERSGKRNSKKSGRNRQGKGKDHNAISENVDSGAANKQRQAPTRMIHDPKLEKDPEGWLAALRSQQEKEPAAAEEDGEIFEEEEESDAKRRKLP